MRTFLRPTIAWLMITFLLLAAMPVLAMPQPHAFVQNEVTNTGGYMTGAIPTLTSNWSTSYPCNFVLKDLWVQLGSYEWIETGVSDGSMRDPYGSGLCNGYKVKYWRGYFTAYQIWTQSSGWVYSEFTYGSGNPTVGTTHNWMIKKITNTPGNETWASYVDSAKILEFAFPYSTSSMIFTGMEGRVQTGSTITFTNGTSTTNHQYQSGGVWYSWCDSVHESSSQCAASVDADAQTLGWNAQFYIDGTGQYDYKAAQYTHP